MKKNIVIVESPAKIKTIKKFLGNDFLVLSTVGHVKDLPKKKTGISFKKDGAIELEYDVLEGKKKVISDICKAASNSNIIYLAPDPDREGEIIAWHIGQEIAKVKKDTSNIVRITFNEITKPAIEHAIADPHKVDMHKVRAQQARRVLDRWVGYEVSPILWRKIKAGLSAGRVQSVALKLICVREQELREFVPQEYWSITGTFKPSGSKEKQELIAALTHINKKKAEIKNEKTAKKITEDIEKGSFSITSINDSKRLKQPPAPFMTSSLQQAAYNRLGLSVKRTMQIAQKLYEGVPLKDSDKPTALITYMRTDSLRISPVALKNVRGFIDQEYGKDYIPTKANVFGKKAKAQDAHEAIRPIDVHVTPEMVAPYLDPQTRKVYTLIWQRFVACQMKPAQYAQRQVVIESKPYTFKATGSTLIFDGFLKVYDTSTEEDKKKNIIPSTIKEQMPLDLAKVEPKQHFTQPPARYTEASLVKELEKEGIGRPSTYATILSTIQARDYTELDERKRFVPTELGMAVTKMLEENLPKIMNIAFTAHMEEDLDKIAQGELKRDELLTDFYKDFSKDLKKFGGEKTERPAEPTDITCPECKKEKLFIRFGKAGAFLGCAGYPDCPFTCNFERLEDGSIKMIKKQPPKTIKESCPKCGKPLQERVGRYGPFVSCSGYPECKYIKQTEAGFPCPECGGTIIKRVWKGNTFWGCSSYPKCRFSIPGDIEETPCKKCKRPYMLKRTNKEGVTTLVCHNKECPSHKK